MFVFDVGSQDPNYSSPLTIYNYDIPTGLIILSCLLTILLFLRLVFFNVEVLKRPKFIENRVVRLSLTIVIFYGLIFEAIYFIYLLRKEDMTSILADFSCLCFTLLFAILIVVPEGRKTMFMSNE